MEEMYEEILQAAKDGDKVLADMLRIMIKAELDSLKKIVLSYLYSSAHQAPEITSTYVSYALKFA